VLAAIIKFVCYSGGIDDVGVFDPALFDSVVFDASPLFVTDTDALQKPVNCVLMGQQLFRDCYRTTEIAPPDMLRRGNMLCTLGYSLLLRATKMIGFANKMAGG
jgi:hypothetical protein